MQPFVSLTPLETFLGQTLAGSPISRHQLKRPSSRGTFRRCGRTGEFPEMCHPLLLGEFSCK